GDLSSAITRVGELADSGVASRLATLGDDLMALVEEAEGESRIAQLSRLLEGIGGAGGGLLGDLAGLVRSLTGGEIPSLPGGDVLQALDGTARALGGMMALESVLAEMERLVATASGAIDAPRLAADLDALARQLEGDGTSMADAV